MTHPQPDGAQWRHRRLLGALLALLSLTGILSMHVVDSRTAAPSLPVAAVVAASADAPQAPVLDARPDHPLHHGPAPCHSCAVPLTVFVPVHAAPGGALVAVLEHPLPSHLADPSAPPP